jgi:two-component system sensor histidine kinase TctE
MQTSNRRLVDVTNKLLLLAQAEHRDAYSGLERLDLATVTLHGVEQLAALADRRRIDLGLEAPVPAWVSAQPALLDALVVNLVDNALRYTPEGGRVTVGVRTIGDTVEFTVEDNGPGIPAESRERVFERFYRASQSTEGTGLGLAIVREIARGFGATVELASNPHEPQGLRATVHFVAAQGAGADPIV